MSPLEEIVTLYLN